MKLNATREMASRSLPRKNSNVSLLNLGLLKALIFGPLNFLSSHCFHLDLDNLDLRNRSILRVETPKREDTGVQYKTSQSKLLLLSENDTDESESNGNPTVLTGATGSFFGRTVRMDSTSFGRGTEVREGITQGITEGITKV